ncbi:MAG TPA: DNA topoisomerase IB [Solirubrobacteraceae bacterium]|jgi:DNA topoisomerase IB|nr:DNA topoisomerase IB [Solirubrobacteraceae bacterium]
MDPPRPSVPSPDLDGSGLVYVTGGELGLRRVGREGDRAVLDASGRPVADEETLERIRALRIPPAWTDVWIAADANAHLQATGVDAKGRRQYLYHPLWRVRRDEQKFDDMLEFADRLPELRARAKQLLGSGGAQRDRTLALAIRLLDIGMFRVGWDRYARDTGHVGLTTLRREHVTLRGTEVRFDFVAKSGKRRRMTVRDPQSVSALSTLKRRRGLPPELLAYRAGREWRRIHAPDVNNALRCWGGGPYSAKEFRTWAATVLAAVALAHEHEAGKRGSRAVSRAVREVSLALGNTPAVARGSYIDPRVIALFDDGQVIDLSEGASPASVPLRVECAEDSVVIELPTDVDGDALRLEIEQRVRGLLMGAR